MGSESVEFGNYVYGNNVSGTNNYSYNNSFHSSMNTQNSDVQFSTISQVPAQQRKTHQTNANLANRFQCEECEFSTTQRAWLERHVKGVHRKQKDYACTHCEYASS